YTQTTSKFVISQDLDDFSNKYVRIRYNPLVKGFVLHVILDIFVLAVLGRYRPTPKKGKPK
ncbi:hypothetical protein ACAG08_25870, partial [Escherichia coli]|uniref:hypothetical protein n=1 Tax=Escherichia coli TaxID=562 RepID=UPI003F9ED9A3